MRFINLEHSGQGTYWTRLPVLTFPSVACEAVPRTAACCSRSAQIFSNEGTSSQRPKQVLHSSTDSCPITTDCISTWQRGHFQADLFTPSCLSAAAPQRGQCLLPKNITPKQTGQEIVAKSASQYRHRSASVDVAAPHIGQFNVSTFILRSFYHQTVVSRSQRCSQLEWQIPY